jgi:protein-disulfide isomerase
MDNTTPSPAAQPTINTPFAIIIAGTLIAGGIYLGLTGGKLPTAGVAGTNINVITVTPGANPGDSQEPTVAKVSVDDDPVLGSKDAPVTMIEFSDYECPFCKQHFTNTFPEIKKDYIDTGKLKLVFRDSPLPFHDPLATNEAVAANCARELATGDKDKAYFDFHDELFKRTTSNGNGLTMDAVYKIAADLKYNAAKFKTCTEAQKHKDEIKKDGDDAVAAGGGGTPTFFVGKSTSSGTIDGEIIVGAVPYASMKAKIDKLLN